MNRSWRVPAVLSWVVLHVFVAAAFAQAPAVPTQNDGGTSGAGRQSQQDSAFSAMQSSLAQQQASLDKFRNSQQSASLQEQRQSVIKQIGPAVSLEPLTAHSGPVQTGTATAKAAEAPVQSADASASPGFFTTPWPSAVPLSIPNVQVVDDSCEPLANEEIGKLVEAASKKHGIDSNLLTSVMRQESAFKPCATSVAGAMGLMQIMPDTADTLGLDDPYDPAKNVDAGAKFLKMMLDRYQGDLPMALGAYNAGPGTVDKAGGVPPIAETVQYISNVLGGLPLAY